VGDVVIDRLPRDAVSLRYARLCASVGTISVRQVAEWMGHANPTTPE
jgi:hypothetical protein